MIGFPTVFVAWTRVAFHRLVLALTLLASMLVAAPGQSSAEDAARPDLRRALGEIATEVPLRQSDFKGLSTLRDRTEALIAESRELRVESAAALERARTARLEAGQIPVAGEREAATRAADLALASIAAQIRDDGKIAVEIEEVWNKITELRRELFSKRLFAYSLSPLSPAFWSELIERALPQIGGKLAHLGAAMSAQDEDNDLATNIAVVALLLLFGLLLSWVTQRLGQHAFARWNRFAARANVSPRRRAAVHALLDLTITAFPIPVTIALLIVLNDGIDFTPGSVDSIALRVLFAVVGYLVGSGVLRAMVAPRDPTHRLLAVSDRTARIVVRTGRALILVYATDLIFGEFAIAAHFRVVISESSTMVMITVCSALLALALLRLRVCPISHDARPSLRTRIMTAAA